jgi:hypothetical protein
LEDAILSAARAGVQENHPISRRTPNLIRTFYGPAAWNKRKSATFVQSMNML